MEQPSLFDDLPPSPGALPDGLRYETGFLGTDEEAALIALVQGLPLQEAQYKGYTARRRVVSYGGSFDYDANALLPSAELIEELQPLRERVAQWAGLDAAALVHGLVAEYCPGTPLGWHRDVPDFEDVFGVSLGSEALLRLRPYPPERPRREDIVRLRVEPRSIYALRGRARWAWQHSVAPVEALRWSITFRTARLAA
ncbi:MULTISPECIES: alpha-ketoglutarate-dependent dioxygenase AlkB [unclassified Roseateles]|uniref:alpha-ketoglutarate-dependent dioxygenase AlkB n=1 Tax=unclassified Roseateles TaxID=2626991 RepID=UPI0007016790|nr:MULTISPECIES: alpha-ketoglutarate-dependent dioxygenase AlkB [unclassified Roseateles]KQW43267.1 2OG-Fe(II) oxygenase [Pelomonas sp. Root405]KRA71005.1 2OG-Fe(II) oxygenase [Pelomonas sp. Root662]